MATTTTDAGAHGSGTTLLTKEDALERVVFDALNSLLDCLRNMERVARRDPILPATAETALQAYRRFCIVLNDVIGNDSVLQREHCARIGAFAEKQLRPYVNSAASASRWRAKPRGYAGDDLCIQVIYDRKGNGRHDFERVVDSLFLEMPAAQAVRNRRKILSSRLQRMYKQLRGSRPMHVTTLAAGPASEIFDAWEELDKPQDLNVCLVDGDPAAVQALQTRTADLGGPASSTKLCSKVHKANLAHVALGKTTLDVPPQDLIYSLGVADYFKDNVVTELLSAAYKLLRPGGVVILGNFHMSNPDKACLDHILEWKLIHRSEEDMHRFMAASLFGGPCEEIIREPTGVQMLAVGRKPLVGSL